MVDKKTVGIGAGVVLVFGIVFLFFFGGLGSRSLLDYSEALKSPQILKVGETEQIEGLSVSVLEVTEDSRCPLDVVCVWEGRVVARVTLDDGTDSETGPIALGESVPFGSYTVTLREVLPEKRENKQIDQSDYQLLFDVEFSPRIQP